MSHGVRLAAACKVCLRWDESEWKDTGCSGWRWQHVPIPEPGCGSLLALQRGCSCGDVLSGDLNSKLVGHEQAMQGKHGSGLALDSGCSDMVWSGCSFPTKLMGLFLGS